MSRDVNPYVGPDQHWTSIDDPDASIVIEQSRSNRWVVRDHRGEIVEMTGGQIRSTFILTPA